jgi:hypothetical protein
MRFMMLYRSSTDSETPPTEQEMAEMGRFIEEVARTGKLIATDGLRPSSRGSRVRISDGGFTVTDGPFTETKEVIGGFAIVQVDSKDEAIELAKRFLQVVGEGESEIREMHDVPAYVAP